MKTFFKLLFVILALSVTKRTGRAMPPIQHSFVGEIVTLDRGTRSIMLRSLDGQTVSVQWNHLTRVQDQGGRHCACVLQPGLMVKVYYRRETAQLMTREIRSR